MVDHDILLNVLENKFGVSDKTLEWQNTYLRPRSCKIEVEEDLSEEQVLTFLVPEGSAAGPTLYLCYVSTMREEILDSISIYGFADDHGLRDSFAVNTDEEQQAIVDLEECMVVVKRWMDLNRLKTNCAKT